MASEAAIRLVLTVMAQTQQAAKPVTNALVEAWMFALHNVADADLRDAAERHMNTSKFWPAPAEIIEQIHGNVGDQGEALWSAVEAAMRAHGRYASVAFHPAANAAIRSIGGWVKLCETNEEELVFRRKDFLTSTKTWLRNPPSDEQSAHLVGLVEGDHVRRQEAWMGEVKLCGPGARESIVERPALPQGPRPDRAQRPAVLDFVRDVAGSKEMK